MKMKKLLTITTITGLLAATSLTVLASPSSVYGDLVGISEDEAKDLAKESDLNFGQLAEEDGLLDEYKAGLISDYEAKLLEEVEAGNLTQEEADQRLIDATIRITASEADEFGRNSKGNKQGNRNGKGQSKDLETVIEENFDGDFDAFKADLLVNYSDRLTKAVENERLTQDEADAKLLEYEAILDAAVDIQSLEEARPDKSGERVKPDGETNQLRGDRANMDKSSVESRGNRVNADGQTIDPSLKGNKGQNRRQGRDLDNSEDTDVIPEV